MMFSIVNVTCEIVFYLLLPCLILKGKPLLCKQREFYMLLVSRYYVYTIH